MQPNCDHPESPDSIYCENCGAVRDSLRQPWRPITHAERTRKEVVNSIMRHILLDFNDEVFNGDDELVAQVKAANGCSYHISVLRVRKRPEQ